MLFGLELLDLPPYVVQRIGRVPVGGLHILSPFKRREEKKDLDPGVRLVDRTVPYR
jgi:hypothetical protein